MLFHYKSLRIKKWLLIMSSLLFVFLVTTAYALNDDAHTRLSMQQLKDMLQQSDASDALHIIVTPEILAQINNIRASSSAREYMRASLQRMQQQKPIIQAELQKQNLPMDLLAVPLVESGYQSLPANPKQMNAAGIWQMIPSTAQKYGLVVNSKQDDRLNTALETKAALTYLKKLHNEFHNWSLALLAYSEGEDKIHALIAQADTADAWQLARSHYGNGEMRKYLQTVGAAVIIMHNPALLD